MQMPSYKLHNTFHEISAAWAIKVPVNSLCLVTIVSPNFKLTTRLERSEDFSISRQMWAKTRHARGL